LSTSPGILDALSLPPANLVLLLALVLGLLSAGTWRAHLGREPWTRLALGLGVMVALRVVLALLAVWAAWDGGVFARTALGNADRATSLISAVLLVWLLLQSSGRLAALIAFTTAGLALVLALASSVLLYSTAIQIPDLRFNTTLLAPLWDASLALTAVIGTALLFVRRPTLRGMALATMGLLLAGAVVQGVLRRPDEDFATLLRAAEVIVYPLFVVWIAVLASRPAHAATVPVTPATSDEPEPSGTHGEAGPPTAVRSMAEDLAFWAARTLNADVALTLARAEDGAGLHITAGYDLVRSQPLLGAYLPGDQSGRIIAQLAQEGVHTYSAADLPADYKRVAEAVGLPQPGPAMLMPLAAGTNASTALLVLSPYSGREWSSEDQRTLGAFAAPLVTDLAPAQLLPEEPREPPRARALMSDAELANLREDNSDLGFRLRQAQEDLQAERRRADSLEVQLTQRTQPESLKEMEAEVSRLEEGLSQVLLNRDEVIASLRASLAGQPVPSPSGEVLHEFMAEQSEEVQRLRMALDRAEKELERQGVGWDEPAGALPPARGGLLGEQVVLSLARELLKAVLSVRSDSELVAGQGAALLGSMQRQPLEHLRDRAYQAEALAQDLENLAAFARSEAPVDWGPLEVAEEVDAALTASSELIRERELSIHLELPETTFDAEADRACVRQLLYHLVRNAVLATPPQSEVGVRAHLRMPEGGPPSALLVSVDDGGAGIAPDDYPMVFDSIARGTGAPLAGLGEKGIGMAVAHQLAQSVGGRIWVESQAGQGSTFSIEVPLAAPQSGVYT
jgi:signal transduction histidine kinase